MSVNFGSESGFCNCGNELLSWGECEDGVCSLCSEGKECFDCGEMFVPEDDELFCPNCKNNSPYGDFPGAYVPRDW